MNKLLQLVTFFWSLSCLSQVNLTSNLKVCLPFNGTAMDLSGNNNNGTISGAIATTDRYGNANSAYLFNGTSDHISLANFATIAPTNELTISMWAKSDITTSNCLFALDPDNQSDRCVGCAQYNNGAGATMMIWDYGDILSGGRISVSPITADIVNWHHYTYILSQSGNIKQMYLDGVIKANTAYGLSCSNKNLPFYIGAGNSNGNGNSIRFHGKIDDVCIYNRALNSNEVFALYNGTGTCFSVGIEELNTISNGIFYPNISETGVFNYSGEIEKLLSVQLYSSEGKLLQTIKQSEILENEKLKLNDFANGFYFLKINKDNSSFMQKIIMNK